VVPGREPEMAAVAANQIAQAPEAAVVADRAVEAVKGLAHLELVTCTRSLLPGLDLTEAVIASWALAPTRALANQEGRPAPRCRLTVVAGVSAAP